MLSNHLIVLFCGLFLPGIFGLTEFGFKSYTRYEPGDMNLIITAPHGGGNRPTRQSNGETWPSRKYGCEGSDGRCTHNCPDTSTTCNVRTSNDLKTFQIAQDIADGIKAIAGERFFN